ncbi:hypothetical protein [Acinetobacter sp. 1125_18A]|uniref:hypothetical protein n=1 Tax=Acinetobacter sp. 1125_18A TaxID=2605959 RepID=UPI004058C5AD
MKLNIHTPTLLFSIVKLLISGIVSQALFNPSLVLNFELLIAVVSTFVLMFIFEKTDRYFLKEVGFFILLKKNLENLK